MSNNPERTRERRGVLAAIFCYLMWGIFPLYWKLLSGVNAFEITAQRIIWCTVFTLILCAIARLNFIKLLKDARARRFLIPAAAIITINWGLYVWAVDIDRIVETAIGYYLNPLVTILLGMIVFKERMNAVEWIAVCLCCIGILFFTVNYGQFPWISIGLALSFGTYGAVKKKGGYPAVEALAFENLVAVGPAIIFAFILASATGSHGFLGDIQTLHGWTVTLLLIGGGAVTAIPLILFATAANSIPLTLLGFIQYLSPTIALLIGVFVNGEPFTLAHGVCLGCIWTGIALVGMNNLFFKRSVSDNSRQSE